ncbi:MAG: Calx-beta domain-containing protein, partial [Pseudohongiellaceae bacterium]
DKASVTEAPGATLAYQVSFTGATHVQNNLTLNYAVDSAGTATSGGNAAEGKNDYTAPSGSLTFATSDGTSQTVLVTVLDDDIVEDDETVILTLGAPTQPRLSLASDATTATGTINDDETPTLSIRAETSPVNEGVPAVFIVTSSNSPMDETVVGVAGTETGDFVTNKTLPTMVTLAASETTATLTVATTNDTADELNGSLAMQIDFANTTPSRYTAGSVTVATVNIEDDDDPPVLTVSSPGVTEPANLVFAVALAPASGKTATVDYGTVDGSATTSGDYRAAIGSLTFLPGETTKQVEVTVLDDELVEGLETLTLRFTNPDNIADTGFTGGNLDATGTITDDEMPMLSIRAETNPISEGDDAVFIIASSNSPMDETVVGVMGVETGNFVTNKTLPTMVTLAASESTATLTVATTNDTADELDGNLAMQIDFDNTTPSRYMRGSVTVANVTIEDDDDPPVLMVSSPDVTEPANLVFAVTLDQVSDKTATVGYETLDGSATESSDYTAVRGSLTFLPGETTKQVEVTVLDDDIVESLETLTLRFTNPDNIADTGFIGGNLDATGTITDDEMPELSIIASAGSVTEGNAAVFTITSTNRPMGDTVIGVSASGADDFVTKPLPTLVTLAAGETAATLNIATIDDAVDEADGSLEVQLNIDSGLSNYTATNASVAIVNIEDNDGPKVSVADARAAERDGHLAFTVALSDTPAEQTEVSWSTADDTTGASPATEGTDYTGASGKLTFTSGTATLSLSVTVNIMDDGDVEPDETFLLTLSAPTNEATIKDAEATGTITSEDVPAVHITADQPAITEGNAALFTITADQSPLANLIVSVSAATSPAAFLADSPTMVTIATGTTAAAYTANTQVVSDTSTGTITATVNGGSSITYTAIAPTSATVTVLDSSTRTISISAPATVAEADNATAEFTVMLSSTPASTGHTVTVNYITVPATVSPATEGSDATVPGADFIAGTGRLTFTGSETSKTIVITVLNDTVFENPNERFRMRIFGPEPSSGNVTGTDTAEVEIEDDETAMLSIASVTGKDSVTEASGVTLAYEVSFPASGATRVQNDLALGYTVSGDATANSDYTALSGRLTFAAGDGTSQTVLVTVLDDDIVEDDETVTLTLGVPTQPRVTLATTSASATGTITDDEMPTLSISAMTNPISEGDDAVFIITSTNRPMDDTVIGVMGSEEGDFVANKALPTMVTLAAFESTVTLRIATTNDTADELDGSLVMQLANIPA